MNDLTCTITLPFFTYLYHKVPRLRVRGVTRGGFAYFPYVGGEESRGGVPFGCSGVFG